MQAVKGAAEGMYNPGLSCENIHRCEIVGLGKARLRVVLVDTGSSVPGWCTGRWRMHAAYAHAPAAATRSLSSQLFCPHRLCALSGRMWVGHLFILLMYMHAPQAWTVWMWQLSG